MAAVSCININVEEDPESVKEIFLNFVIKVKKSQDQDEQVIVNI